MNSQVEDLVRIASMQVPNTAKHFTASHLVRGGTPAFKGVGPSLAGALEQVHYTHSPGGPVEFYQSIPEEPGLVPDSFLRSSFEPLSWWQLHYCFTQPSEELRNALRNGTQVGCLAHVSGGPRAIRLQIGWNDGHNIGFRPLTPGWIWSAGTVFAAALAR